MQVTSSSAIALQLLSNQSADRGAASQQASREPFSEPPTRYVEGMPGLTGVYTDPRVGAPAEPSLAQRVIDAIEATHATDVRAFKQRAKAGLEAALGRPLADGETFSDLGSWTRSRLPKDVLNMNRSVEMIDFAMGAATSRAKEINLEKSYSLNVSNGTPFLDKPEGLRDVDMSKAKDRQRVVDHAIRLQTQINMAGINIAKSDKTASEMMSKSLATADVENMDDLKDSYAICIARASQTASSAWSSTVTA